MTMALWFEEPNLVDDELYFPEAFLPIEMAVVKRCFSPVHELETRKEAGRGE